jgi:hypothetical protein
MTDSKILSALQTGLPAEIEKPVEINGDEDPCSDGEGSSQRAAAGP